MISALYGIKYARDVDESQFEQVSPVNEWDFWKDMDEALFRTIALKWYKALSMWYCVH